MFGQITELLSLFRLKVAHSESLKQGYRLKFKCFSIEAIIIPKYDLSIYCYLYITYHIQVLIPSRVHFAYTDNLCMNLII